MPLGSQVNVDPATSGTPQPLASETISAKEYQGVLIADASGNVVGSTANPFGMRNAPNSATGSFTASQAGQAATVATSAVEFDLAGNAGVSVDLSGSWAGTITFQVSNNGTSWTQIHGQATTLATGVGGTATGNGVYQFNAGGARYFRVVCTAFSSGTIEVSISATATAAIVKQAGQVGGDVAHDAVNTLQTVQVGGHAVDIRTGQTAVGVGDRVRVAADLNGRVVVRARQAIMYSALYRLATRPYPLSFVMTANSRKQFATIFHAATATKHLRLRRVYVAIRSISAAAILSVDLVRLTNATTPATGNPVITAPPHDASDPAAETTTIALPTTAGAEVVGSPINSEMVETAAVTPAVGSTTPPVRTTNWLTLYKSDLDMLDDAPLIPLGVAGGFAVVIDSNAAVTVTALVEMDFTETTV